MLIFDDRALGPHSLHTRYIGYVTEGGFRDIPKDFCPAEDMKAAGQEVCNRLAFQGVCNRGLVARNATTHRFGITPYNEYEL